MPRLGERYQEPDMVLANEWTGDAWTSVCPTDDVPLAGRDAEGWLICAVCKRRHHEIAEKAQRNAK